jgi:hypothetical protein
MKNRNETYATYLKIIDKLNRKKPILTTSFEVVRELNNEVVQKHLDTYSTATEVCAKPI